VLIIAIVIGGIVGAALGTMLDNTMLGGGGWIIGGMLGSLLIIITSSPLLILVRIRDHVQSIDCELMRYLADIRASVVSLNKIKIEHELGYLVHVKSKLDSIERLSVLSKNTDFSA
jgi:hypothetical protein